MAWRMLMDQKLTWELKPSEKRGCFVTLSGFSRWLGAFLSQTLGSVITLWLYLDNTCMPLSLKHVNKLCNHGLAVAFMDTVVGYQP